MNQSHPLHPKVLFLLFAFSFEHENSSSLSMFLLAIPSLFMRLSTIIEYQPAYNHHSVTKLLPPPPKKKSEVKV